MKIEFSKMNDPQVRLPTVVQGLWKRMLGGQPVIDRESERVRHLIRYSSHIGLVGEGSHRNEATTVNVDENVLVVCAFDRTVSGTRAAGSKNASLGREYLNLISRST